MNLLENKMIRRFVAIGLFPYALALLIVISAGVLTIFNLNIFDTYRNILCMIYPFTMIAMAFLGYRFLYDKRYYSLHTQTNLNEKQKLVLPLIAILVPSIIFDIFNITVGIDEFSIFYLVYFKYLVLSFTILFIISSSSILKMSALLILSAFAILVNGEMFTILGDDLASFIIVLFLVAVPLIASYFIYFYQKKIHNSDVIDKIYYFQIFMIVLVFLRELFVTNYPYYMYGFTFQVLSSNINITFYLLAFICIGIFVYLIEQKVDFKKIFSLIGISIFISIAYVGISNVDAFSTTDCNPPIKNKKNIDLSIMDNYLTTFDDPKNAEKMQEYLNSKANSCFKAKTISAGLDTKTLEKNNEIVFTFNGINYLISRDKIDYKSLLNLMFDDNKLLFYSLGGEFNVYSARELDKKDMQKVKEAIKNYFDEDDFKYYKLNDKQIDFLFSNLIYSFSNPGIFSDDYDRYDEDYISYIEVSIINLNDKYGGMMSIVIDINRDIIKEFKQLGEEANHD